MSIDPNRQIYLRQEVAKGHGEIVRKGSRGQGHYWQLESFFLVPRYQRNYAWTVDQIEEFWNDLSVGKGPFSQAQS